VSLYEAHREKAFVSYVGIMLLLFLQQFPMRELVQYGLQVADGMDYCSSESSQDDVAFSSHTHLIISWSMIGSSTKLEWTAKLVHRDLAARNCM